MYRIEMYVWVKARQSRSTCRQSNTSISNEERPTPRPSRRCTILSKPTNAPLSTNNMLLVSTTKVSVFPPARQHHRGMIGLPCSIDRPELQAAKGKYLPAPPPPPPENPGKPSLTPFLPLAPNPRFIGLFGSHSDGPPLALALVPPVPAGAAPSVCTVRADEADPSFVDVPLDAAPGAQGPDAGAEPDGAVGDQFAGGLA